MLGADVLAEGERLYSNVLLQNFAIDLIDMRERFNLVIGGVFLAIVLFSPDGLLGLWQWFVGWARSAGGAGGWRKDRSS
jgi:hypothetical protein